MRENNGRVYQVVGKDLLKQVIRKLRSDEKGLNVHKPEDCFRLGEHKEPRSQGKDKSGLERCVQKARVLGALRETALQ